MQGMMLSGPPRLSGKVLNFSEAVPVRKSFNFCEKYLHPGVLDKESHLKVQFCSTNVIKKWSKWGKCCFRKVTMKCRFQRSRFFKKQKKPFLRLRLENHGFLKTYQNAMSHQDEVIGFSIEFLLPDQVLFLFAFGLELEVAAMPFGERCRGRKRGSRWVHYLLWLDTKKFGA